MMLKQHWSNFTAAPHRVMFFGGAFQIIAAMMLLVCFSPWLLHYLPVY